MAEVSALTSAMAEIDNRLRAIRVSAGFNTDMGGNLHPAGTWLSQDDAPCMAVYEAKPNDDGVMKIVAEPRNACGQGFIVDYMVQAFVPTLGRLGALNAAEEVAIDIMRALMGPDAGALANANGHRITGRGRGLAPKGANTVPVLVYGTFKVSERIYQ